MSNLSSILKWAWQAHFWSHRPVTLQNYTFSEYVQMILLALFKISYNKKFEKNPKAFMSISVAYPWSICPSVRLFLFINLCQFCQPSRCLVGWKSFLSYLSVFCLSVNCHTFQLWLLRLLGRLLLFWLPSPGPLLTVAYAVA